MRDQVTRIVQAIANGGHLSRPHVESAIAARRESAKHRIVEHEGELLALNEAEKVLLRLVDSIDEIPAGSPDPIAPQPVR
jgi:hypothetical protein